MRGIEVHPCPIYQFGAENNSKDPERCSSIEDMTSHSVICAHPHALFIIIFHAPFYFGLRGRGDHAYTCQFLLMGRKKKRGFMDAQPLIELFKSMERAGRILVGWLKEEKGNG